METGFMNRIIGLVLALVVGGLLVGGLLIPSIEGMTATEKTFTNSGTYYMTDDDEDYTLVYDPTGKFIVNGEDIPFTDFPTGLRTTIVSTEEWLIRFAANGTTYGVTLIVGEGDNPLNDICAADNAVNTTFAFSNGTLTITGNKSATYTYTPESFRGIAKEGAYVMTAENSPAKINSTTTIIVGNGTTQVGHWYDRFYIEGTVDNMNVTAPEGITVSDVEVNTASVSGYVDLVELTSITFSATDGDNNIDATYNRVIVPKEITAELSQHMDATQIAMFGVISILGIVALVVVAANGIRNKY